MRRGGPEPSIETIIFFRFMLWLVYVFTFVLSAIIAGTILRKLMFVIM